MGNTDNNTKVVQTTASKTAFGQKVSAFDLRTEGEIANSPDRAVALKSTGGHMFKNTKNTDRSKDINVTHVHKKAGY